MRSVAALIDELASNLDFYVITRDRDEGSKVPYPIARVGTWQAVGKGKVRYLKSAETSLRSLVRIVRQTEPDVVYLNSVFAPLSLRLLLAHRLGALKRIPVLVAPRGELSPGALRLHTWKKRGFLLFAAWLGLHRRVVFHASTRRERDEIMQALPGSILRIARNPVLISQTAPAVCSKTPGSARFVFLSRITRKKNLHVAIELISSLRGSIEFDIYGPVIDDRYWRACLKLIAKMPRNVVVSYRGPIAHDLVTTELAKAHFCVLPTASENFGHVIVEALVAGCPVITSDQTPWLQLADLGIGWDLALHDGDAWRRVLQMCVDMDTTDHQRFATNCRRFGKQIVSTNTAADNLALFRSMCGGSELET